jgi:hypothetical protein
MTLQRVHWLIYFLLWTAGISAVGALIGAVSFPLLGLAFGWKFTAGELAYNGASNLGRLFFYWGIVIAAIACVMRRYRRLHGVREPAQPARD